MFVMRISIVTSIAVLTAASLGAEAPAKFKDAAPREEAALIRQATANFVTAFNAADFTTMAEQWKPDGQYIDDTGKSTDVQTRWKQVSQSSEPRPPRELAMSVETVRLVTPEVAVSDGLSSLKLGAAKARHGRYTTVWVKQEGDWLIDSVRESQLAANSHHLHLLELDWLVGRWSADDNNHAVRMTVSWSPDQNFLIREIELRALDGTLHSATQRIGWDPLKEEFKSWLFDSTGGFFEGIWERVDGSWVIDTLGVGADGKVVKSQGRCTRVDENTILWESTHTTVDGQPQPEIEARLVRQSAK